MIRIIRTETLRALRAAAAEAAAATAEAEKWHGLYQEETAKLADADEHAENLLRELAQEHADRFVAERERGAAQEELATARREFQETGTRVRELFEEMLAAARDPQTGSVFQGLLALKLMRQTLAADIERGNDDAFTLALARLLAAPEVGE
ncbi:hypothetical protein [Streptomyces flavofungini]|uniref:hypothetical protein n=1 Tax=Streptomyces flavofungini TaxID=68200 RepID=UPI0025B151A5|nr:hypothetical protein [Streptomyces flavofungini]WJV47665.1 hypothetical protein QUY26_20325 [Streptomyces flavofungini]